MSQQVDENNINDFFQKMLAWGKSTILDPKIAHPLNSGLAEGIFKMNGANSAQKLLMTQPKKFLFGENGPFRTQNVTSCLTDFGSAVRIVLQFCTLKEAKRDMGIILMVFLKEIF